MMNLNTTWMTTSNLSKTGVALLMLSLGAACSDDPAATTTDGGSDGGGMDGSATDSGLDGAKTDGGKKDDAGLFASPGPVALGGAGDFAILAKSGISTVPTSAITGNLGLSPAAPTYITGFGETADSTNVFSISPQVTGKIYGSTYASPTPSNLTTAVGSMELAFTDAAGRAPDVTELGAGDIGGMTLTRGVYKWSSGLLLPTSVTLTGSATDVWIFQIAQNLTMASAKSIILAGGAVSKNVFWQVSGAVELGTTSHFEGIVMAQTEIALRTGASINGRLFAQSDVVIESSIIVQPAP